MRVDHGVVVEELSGLGRGTLDQLALSVGRQAGQTLREGLSESSEALDARGETQVTAREVLEEELAMGHTCRLTEMAQFWRRFRSHSVAPCMQVQWKLRL